MPHRIEIVVDDCMSSGKCVADYPKTFDFDDHELGMMIDDGQPLTDDDMVRVARNCPSRAIQVFDDAGNLVAT